MKHLHFEPEADGFYGAYWESKTPSDTAMIAMLGDDPEDYMGKTCVKWLQENRHCRCLYNSHSRSCRRLILS